MSKQDGYSPRTAVDLERKYNFGQSFAEVYGLAGDARKAAEDAALAAEEAKKVVEGLDPEEIFNRLTNYGEWQGIYRGDDGGVYINASFIKSGTIKAGQAEIEAATITGQLVATQIDAKDLKVLAANITGTLTAGQIDTTNLNVSAANITGKLTASQIDATNLSVKAANITGVLAASQIDATNLSVKAANITGKLTATQIDTTSLSVSAANISGTLTIGQMPSGVAKTTDIPQNTSDLYNDSGYQTRTQVTTITNNAISTAEISADQITTGSLDASMLELEGEMALTHRGVEYGYMGVNTSKGGPAISDDTGNVFFVVTNNAAKMSYYEDAMIWVHSSGCYASETMQVYSDRTLKNSISYDLDTEEALFAKLRPCSFAYNKDKESRKHWGFIAQDLLDGAEKVGLDTDKLAVLGQYDGKLSVGYGEITALNTHMIQKLIARVAALEEKLA